MGDVAIEVVAYAKIILHAAKYPHCAVNGVLLADASNLKDGSKSQLVDIVDSIPLFHHSHYLSPMAEVALTQIETVAQADNRVIAGYYAACENFNDNTVEKCPGQKIAEKIAEHFPSAIFFVVDNKKIMPQMETSPLKMYKYSDGKWKIKESQVEFLTPYFMETMSSLLQEGVQRDFVDFDNYLDDLSQDWMNSSIQYLINSYN